MGGRCNMCTYLLHGCQYVRVLQHVEISVARGGSMAGCCNMCTYLLHEWLLYEGAAI